MKTAQGVEEFEYVQRFDQHVVVIGKHAPGDRLGVVLREQVQQHRRKLVQAFWRKPDVRRMVVTSG